MTSRKRGDMLWQIIFQRTSTRTAFRRFTLIFAFASEFSDCTSCCRQCWKELQQNETDQEYPALNHDRQRYSALATISIKNKIAESLDYGTLINQFFTKQGSKEAYYITNYGTHEHCHCKSCTLYKINTSLQLLHCRGLCCSPGNNCQQCFLFGSFIFESKTGILHHRWYQISHSWHKIETFTCNCICSVANSAA